MYMETTKLTAAQQQTLAQVRRIGAETGQYEIAPTQLGGKVTVYGNGRVLHVYGNLNRITVFPDGRYTTTDYSRTTPRPTDVLTS
jgi:hypothetical protein